MKKFWSLVFILLALLGYKVVASFDEPVEFQSLESKTGENLPVVNEIQLITNETEDVWMMRQHHARMSANKEHWDRLAIVVSKNNSPKQAEYFQLPPGKIEWTAETRELRLPNKIDCSNCHINGPRKIRPDPAAGSHSLAQKIKLFWWNLKLQRYGKLVNKSYAKLTTEKSGHEVTLMNSKFSKTMCDACHHDGPTGRGSLRLRHSSVIQFMVTKGFMPPSQFFLSKKQQDIVHKTYQITN